MESPRFFILYGAPGCGKSKVCNILMNITNDAAKVIQKETIRPSRPTDSYEIKSVKSISEKCDFCYSQYRYDYGFPSVEVWEALGNRQNAVVIVNDIRTIKQLKRRFGALARAIYIHSNINKSSLRVLANERNPEMNDDTLQLDVDRRIEKIKTVHRKYIENTHLFDETILNVYEKATVESLSNLKKQLQSIVLNQKSFGEPLPSTARVFIVVGGSYSGKDELVNAMKIMDPKRVDSYRKQTDRPKRASDNNELHHVKTIYSNFDIIYEKNGFSYGISSKELWQLLSKGKVLLLIVSDYECIELLKKMFGGTCAVLFLHADFDYDEIKEEMISEGLKNDEIKKRLMGIEEIKQLYINRMGIFNHVLLNTSEPEDLYDQAFNILDYYCD